MLYFIYDICYFQKMKMKIAPSDIEGKLKVSNV